MAATLYTFGYDERFPIVPFQQAVRLFVRNEALRFRIELQFALQPIRDVSQMSQSR